MTLPVLKPDGGRTEGNEKGGYGRRAPIDSDEEPVRFLTSLVESLQGREPLVGSPPGDVLQKVHV